MCAKWSVDATLEFEAGDTLDSAMGIAHATADAIERQLRTVDGGTIGVTLDENYKQDTKKYQVAMIVTVEASDYEDALREVEEITDELNSELGHGKKIEDAEFDVVIRYKHSQDRQRLVYLPKEED